MLIRSGTCAGHHSASLLRRSPWQHHPCLQRPGFELLGDPQRERALVLQCPVRRADRQGDRGSRDQPRTDPQGLPRSLRCRGFGLHLSPGRARLPGLARFEANQHPTYEYTVVERDGGRLVPVSIKTGATPVDIGQLASTAKASGKAVACSTEGHYDGDGCGRVEQIENAELLRFRQLDHRALTSSCPALVRVRPRRRQLSPGLFGASSSPGRCLDDRVTAYLPCGLR